MQDVLVQPPDVLKLMAHEVRWNLLQHLSHSDYRVQDLVERLQLPQNLISYHLKQLRLGQLVTERRSSADSRDIYYSLDLQELRQRYFATGTAIHPVLGLYDLVRHPGDWHLPSPLLRILFLCTKNSARSQMAEGLLRHLSEEQVAVTSAGSTPTILHPEAVRVMAMMGIDISHQSSKHVREVTDQDFDLVVTVCDRMREICPSFANTPLLVHWSVPDPVEMAGSDEEVQRAFEQTAEHLAIRVRFLLTELERKRSNSE